MIYTFYLVNDNDEIIETISLDVINSFGEDYSSSIAQNVVENGYPVSDSVSLSNPKFSVSGVITDSKFRVKDHLVMFDGNTFVKTNAGAFETVSDDDGAEIVKERLFKLWENKEVFGIMESKDITNIKGSQVRNIFPCILTNLSFTNSDTANAFYPTMSIEKIRYAVVTVGKVTNPIPELTPKYQDELNAQSKANSSSGGASDDSSLKDADKEARDAISGASTGDGGGKTKTQRGVSLRTLNLSAQKQAVARINAEGLTGSKADAVRERYAKEWFDNAKAGEGHPKAVYGVIPADE